MAVLVIIGVIQAKNKAIDTQVKSDITFMTKVLELYYSDEGFWPTIGPGKLVKSNENSFSIINETGAVSAVPTSLTYDQSFGLLDTNRSGQKLLLQNLKHPIPGEYYYLKTISDNYGVCGILSDRTNYYIATKCPVFTFEDNKAKCQ